MDFVAIDVETANSARDSICQIGIARFANGIVVEEWKSYVNPSDYFDDRNVSIHGIKSSDVTESPTFADLAEQLHARLRDRVVVSHSSFDRVAIVRAAAKHNVALPSCIWLDSSRVARRAWEAFQESGYGLKNVCTSIGYSFDHHDALEDAKAAGAVLIAAGKHTGLDLAGWLAKVVRPINEPAYSPGSTRESTARDGDHDGPLHGEVLVFTGALEIPRREAADMAAKAGCQVATVISKSTTLLVVGDQDLGRTGGEAKSSKHRKADELILKGQPIRILGESDFRALVHME